MHVFHQCVGKVKCTEIKLCGYQWHHILKVLLISFIKVKLELQNALAQNYYSGLLIFLHTKLNYKIFDQVSIYDLTL